MARANRKYEREVTVALAGNPNTGKSTVFNALTGLRQHTGNWPGKTVARAEGGFLYRSVRYKVVDLPGVDPKSVDVSLAGNMLAVKGNKPPTPTEAEPTTHTAERAQGPFSRSIPMPSPVNPDAVSAESQEGVLRIRIGKSEKAKARKIPVETTGESPPRDPGP